MKKPIDPSLNNIGEDDFLLDIEDEKKSGELSFAKGASPGHVKEPEFKVTEIAEDGTENTVPKRVDLSNSDMNVVDKFDDKYESSHHHHHSSDGSHHHHSSGDGSHHHHHHSSSGSSHHHSSSHHSSSHSHSKNKDKDKLPLPAKIAIGILLAIFLVFVVIIVTFFVLKYMGEKDVKPVITEDTAYEETIEYNGHTYKYNEDVFSMAFLGVDQREMQSVLDVDFVGAADADIVLTVDTKTGKARVIAIPRDTMVDINVYSESNMLLRTDYAQLCLAYAYGDGMENSCKNSLTSISRVLYNVPIQKYFALDLDGIAPLNDAIGGVTIDNSLYAFKEHNINIGDKVTLHGDMAESYVRTRDMDSVNASLNRTDRQVQYIKAYASQAVPAVIKDFGIISNLYNTASDYSQTNLTLSNATYIASLLLSKGVTDFETYTLKGEMKEGKDVKFADIVHAEFYPDKDNLMQIVLDVFYTQID